MKGIDKYIESLNQKLPDLCTTRDLIKLGIFSSTAVAEYYRKTNLGPSYFVLGEHRIRYPKLALIEWLEKGKHVCQETTEDSGEKAHC